jgi:hypothetical protein
MINGIVGKGVASLRTSAIKPSGLQRRLSFALGISVSTVSNLLELGKVLGTSP